MSNEDLSVGNVDDLELLTSQVQRANLAVSIANGTLDDMLDLISQCIRDRREILRMHKALHARASIHKDDRVRLGGNITPQYLRGAVGTCYGIENGKILVILDPRFRQGRFSSGRPIGCPASCVEKL